MRVWRSRGDYTQYLLSSSVMNNHTKETNFNMGCAGTVSCVQKDSNTRNGKGNGAHILMYILCFKIMNLN